MSLTEIVAFIKSFEIRLFLKDRKSVSVPHNIKYESPQSPDRWLSYKSPFTVNIAPTLTLRGGAFL